MGFLQSKRGRNGGSGRLVIILSSYSDWSWCECDRECVKQKETRIGRDNNSRMSACDLNQHPLTLRSGFGDERHTESILMFFWFDIQISVGLKS